MPDVKIYMPAALADDPLLLREIGDMMRGAVVDHLECNDYSGKPLKMTGDMIDITFITRGTGSTVGSRLIIEVTAYDYPERMANIGERLQRILYDGVPFGVTAKPSFKRASISFFPLKDGCWQATAD